MIPLAGKDREQRGSDSRPGGEEEHPTVSVGQDPDWQRVSAVADEVQSASVSVDILLRTPET